MFFFFFFFFFLQTPLQKNHVFRSIENYTHVNVQECYLIQFSGQPAIVTFTFHKDLSFQTVIFKMINFQLGNFHCLFNMPIQSSCLIRVPMESLMGPLLNMVTYGTKTPSWMSYIIHWGKKNKEKELHCSKS